LLCGHRATKAFLDKIQASGLLKAAKLHCFEVEETPLGYNMLNIGKCKYIIISRKRFPEYLYVI